ncbi:hypothetical protein [Pyxidicoccus xibeiensis]|uniref:hypothetical protein n=1 Tax=Pyxidicoccus xibeiensis TaxID=2906759 RepID=UPI0020A70C71|nr:hypothetical protein [Pyxidicoccus xibeiensis]MCP3143142.1 hypothetical protein [Pyxidicoccus xibeiensis]
MNRLFVIAVTLGGALVTGCSGLTEEPPASEAAAPVASVRQKVLSPGLVDALECLQGYVEAGTCDWEHWSEMHELCATYDHPELEDGFFLEEVQAGRCTATHWPTLRAQVVAAAAPVLVRTHCDSSSQVMQGTELDGCFTLQGTGASYVSVTYDTAATLYSGAGCTGEALAVQADTSLCGTSYPSGAGANDNVRSYRLHPAQERPSSARYTCAPDEPTCVTNFNSKVDRVNSTHTVKIVRVAQAGRTTASIADIRNDIYKLYDFFGTASRGQVSLNLLEGSHRTVTVPSTANCGQAEAQATRVSSNSDAFLTVIRLPAGLCKPSSPAHAGSHRIYMRNGLQNIYAHEVGHVLGLNHGERILEDGSTLGNSDTTTLMARMPATNYNLPQLHWLGWTKKEDLVQVNSAIEDGSAFDITLRPVDLNVDDGSGLPLGAVYEIPGKALRLFISMPRSRTTDINPVEGGSVFVHRARICEGCTGMVMGTMRIEQFSATSTAARTVRDLVITPLGFTSHLIREDGKNVEVFDTVTLRIQRAAPVLRAP